MVNSKGKDDADGRREELTRAAEENPAIRSPVRKIFQSRFHNFSFPMTSWGSYRLLRCVNPVSGTGGFAAGSTALGNQIETRNGIIPSCSPESSYPPPVSGPKDKEAEPVDTSSAAARPWKLRTRRSLCRPSVENCLNRCPSSSFSGLLLGKNDQGRADLLRSDGGEKLQRPKFYISLSHEEIEEDFYSFRGLKPSRRPKKRARIVQRRLDSIFPGLWLSEITVDSYKVNE